MLTFLANARDGSGSGATSCGTCCCEAASARPGETNKWAINYANWVAGIGGRGLVSTPAFDVTKLSFAAAAAAANKPPTNANYSAVTAINTATTGTVATSAADPEGAAMTFAHLALYGPVNGRLAFAADGAWTYTPDSQFVGDDRFWFSTSDGTNVPVVNQVSLRVNDVAPAAQMVAKPAIPVVGIDPLKVAVATPVVSFPLSVSPAAVPGDIYRLTVIQNAMDCDGTVYSHQMCFDIVIGKC